MAVTGATCRTSSDTGSGGDCVEVVNHTQDGRVLVRDTKRPPGTDAGLQPQSWRDLTTEIKDQRP